MAKVGDLTVNLKADARQLIWRLNELQEQTLRIGHFWSGRQMIADGLPPVPQTLTVDLANELSVELMAEEADE